MTIVLPVKPRRDHQRTIQHPDRHKKNSTIIEAGINGSIVRKISPYIVHLNQNDSPIEHRPYRSRLNKIQGTR